MDITKQFDRNPDMDLDLKHPMSKPEVIRKKRRPETT